MILEEFHHYLFFLVRRGAYDTVLLDILNHIILIRISEALYCAQFSYGAKLEEFAQYFNDLTLTMSTRYNHCTILDYSSKFQFNSKINYVGRFIQNKFRHISVRKSVHGCGLLDNILRLVR